MRTPAATAIAWLAAYTACTKSEPRDAAPAAAAADAAPAMTAPAGKKMNRKDLIWPGVGDGPARVQTPEEAAAYGDPQCPRYVGKRTTAARMIGKHGRTLNTQEGYLWQNKDGKLYVFDGKTKHPIRELRPPDIPKGVVALDAMHWYVKRCHPDGCGPHGTGVVIDRIVVGRGKQEPFVTEPQSELVSAQAYDDHLYWITFGPYGETGELRRMAKKNGKVETLWRGRGMHAMLIDGDDVFATDGVAVAAVSRRTGKARVLVEGLQEARGLAADADHLYIAEYGDPYWASEPSGYIKRVPRGGGDVTTLAGPIKWPTVVAVDEHRVYYMLKEPGDIWAITKATGGPPTMLVPTPPSDSSCQSSKWLRAEELGLKWVRMVEGFHSGNLWALSREHMPPPPDTPMAWFRKWMEQSDAGVPDDTSLDE